jgi:hypothetical protein
MYGQAHDSNEAADLRRRLRLANIPVGQYGSVETLRRVAATHGLWGHSPIAMDSRRSSVSTHSSLAKTFPDIYAHMVGLGGSVSGGYATGDAAREYENASLRRRGVRPPAMALDASASRLPERLSIRAMFPDIAKRLGG